MSNKRLTLKLDELEAIISTTNQTMPKTPPQVNQSPIKELDLNVKTQETGNNEKELEIALNQLRRRNRQLEDKLATLYRQLQDKENEMKKMHAEMSASIESLERSNFEKAKGMRGSNLYRTLTKEIKAGLSIFRFSKNSFLG